MSRKSRDISFFKSTPDAPFYLDCPYRSGPMYLHPRVYIDLHILTPRMVSCIRISTRIRLYPNFYVSILSCTVCTFHASSDVVVVYTAWALIHTGGHSRVFHLGAGISLQDGWKLDARARTPGPQNRPRARSPLPAPLSVSLGQQTETEMDRVGCWTFGASATQTSPGPRTTAAILENVFCTPLANSTESPGVWTADCYLRLAE